jgi:hypothetical protein
MKDFMRKENIMNDKGRIRDVLVEPVFYTDEATIEAILLCEGGE